jgi:DNA-binding transcriptional regulator LsrR (DeoR family)
VNSKEKEIMNIYPQLKDVVLTSTSCYDYSQLRINIGKNGAVYLDKLIDENPGMKIGIGGGGTVYDAIDHLEKKPRNICIFPTSLVTRGPEIMHVDSCFLTELFFFKSRPEAKGYSVSVPPLPNTKANAEKYNSYLLENFDEIKWIYSSMQNLDTMILGAGAVLPSGGFENEMNKLGIPLISFKEKKIIGGINYNWICEDDNEIDTPFLTIKTARLKELSLESKKNIILIAGGLHKQKIIKEIIKRSIVNILISDIDTANYLLGGDDDT